MLNPTATVPLLPGFSEPVHSFQRIFRSLLNALAHPGSVQAIADIITVPPPLNAACGVASLTLFDGETTVWLQPRDGMEAVKTWLQFHCGCLWTTTPSTADFAVITEPLRLESLSMFNWGNPETPERSATLLVQVQALTCSTLNRGTSNCSALDRDIDPEQFSLESAAGLPSTNTLSIPHPLSQRLHLQGPGIEHEQSLDVQGVPLQFWQELALNQTAYPLGLDVFLLSSENVVGLPRTTIIHSVSVPLS